MRKVFTPVTAILLVLVTVYVLAMSLLSAWIISLLGIDSDAMALGVFFLAGTHLVLHKTIAHAIEGIRLRRYYRLIAARTYPANAA
jgi:hypothetical protein